MSPEASNLPAMAREIGPDLQYIRINGTIVGGLAGLLIYLLTHAVA